MAPFRSFPLTAAHGGPSYLNLFDTATATWPSTISVLARKINTLSPTKQQKFTFLKESDYDSKLDRIEQ